MKTAVVYWSGTGNTETMAKAVGAAAEAKGAEVSYFTASEFNADVMVGFDAVAFGCPAMGAVVLEEDEFEPMFSGLEGSLSGKKIGLFGSYGWGDGQWMRDWQNRAKNAGAELVMDGVMANNEPDDAALSECKALGEALA